MNYLVLIIVALTGIALGMYIARRNANAGFIAEQVEQKPDNETAQTARDHRALNGSYNGCVSR